MADIIFNFLESALIVVKVTLHKGRMKQDCDLSNSI